MHTSNRRWISLAVSAGVLVAVALPSIATADVRGDSPAHFLGMKGASPRGSSTSSNLVDHGGPVLASSDTYAIWWGPTSAWPNDVVPGMDAFFGNVNGSPLLNIAQQYMRSTSISSTFKGSAVDTSNPPKKVNPSTLAAEVKKELSQLGGVADPNGIYFVFTSNFPRGGNFCAWHAGSSVNGTAVAVAYMPNTTGVGGCDPTSFVGAPPNGESQGLESLANVTSHEFMEAVTDPQPSGTSYGWIDTGGQEIGDKCAWTFNTASTSQFGSYAFYLQKEWSNDANGPNNVGSCVSG